MRPRTGCQACRSKHLRCIRRPEREQCERCHQFNRDCVTSSGHLFKKVQNTYRRTEKGRKVKEPLSHAVSQTWVQVPSVLTFVGGQDEAESRQVLGVGDDNEESGGALDERRSELDDGDSGGHALHETAEEPAPNSELRVSGESPMWVSVEGNSQQRYTGTSALGTSNRVPITDLVMNLDHRHHTISNPWQFQSTREAQLFSHFIKRVSPSIDVLDGRRCFGKEVPRRAVSQPLIANAIYAVASLHLRLLDGSVDIESPSYLDRSLQLLKHALDRPLGYDDETLLAGIVLLRTYEEMSPQDDTIHILGGERLLSSIASYSANGGLKEAASWILLRQHIYIALTTQSPLRLNLALYEKSGVFNEHSDESWANRAVLLFARIINLAYGVGVDAEAASNTAIWDDLERQVESWHGAKPWYFNPLCLSMATDASQSWPNIVVSEPAHAVGLQYYSLCKLILVAYRPTNPDEQPGHPASLNSTDNAILDHLRRIVGLAVSNPEVTNLLFEASHILAVFGRLLDGDGDRNAAIGFLHDVRQTTGWPTEATIKKLREHWRIAGNRVGIVRR